MVDLSNKLYKINYTKYSQIYKYSDWTDVLIIHEKSNYLFGDFGGNCYYITGFWRTPIDYYTNEKFTL